MNIAFGTDTGRRGARSLADSRPVEIGGRAGFVARGVIYVLVGVLAVRIAGADGAGQQADRGGALAEIAHKPFGHVLLWLLGAALAGMALWRLSEAVVGQAGPDGGKPAKRVAAAARCVFYGLTSYSVLAYAVGGKGSGSGSADTQTDDVTAKALDRPGGQWIVAVAGTAVVCAGVWIAARAAMRSFRKPMKLAEMSRRQRRMVDFLGVCGGMARGVVFAAAGVFAVVAAVQHDPGKSKGMDDTLRSFADTPAGPSLLVVVAVGLIAFGAFSWANARWRKV